MAFFREKFSKLTGLWTVSSVSVSQYNSKRLAKDIEKESTVSYTDIMAVLTSLPSVMQRYLAEGHTVKLEGIGTFYLTVQCTKTGVERKEDCSQEQITNVKVQFRPEREGTGRKGVDLPAGDGEEDPFGRRRHADTDARPHAGTGRGMMV